MEAALHHEQGLKETAEWFKEKGKRVGWEVVCDYNL